MDLQTSVLKHFSVCLDDFHHLKQFDHQLEMLVDAK